MLSTVACVISAVVIRDVGRMVSLYPAAYAAPPEFPASPMAKNKLRSVVSIRVVASDGTCTTVYKHKAAKRKQSMGLDAVGKAQRRFVTAATQTGNAYIKRHDRSNKRTKDGWLVDAVSNLVKSAPDIIKEVRKQAIN